MRTMRLAFAALIATTASFAAPGIAKADEPTLTQILTALYPGYTQTQISAPLWQTLNGSNAGNFDLQVKYATGGATTFGFFNPTASTSPGAPTSTQFNAVFTVSGDNGFSSNNPTQGLNVYSHVNGPHTQVGTTGTATALNTNGQV